MLLEHLAHLVALAVELPEVEPTSDGDSGPGSVADAGAIATRFLRALGARDIYWEVYDPRVEDAPVAGSLTDDLAEVYGDLQRGLALMEAGERDNAVWEWRFLFEVHWGLHAVDAMRVLHRLTFD